MSSLICANCQHQALPPAHYCSQCGQHLHVHRINAHYLWHELQHGLLHVDKGILYTAKELTQRPGRMVREFLAGNRAAHFKPVSYLVITAGLYGFLQQFAPKFVRPASTAPALAQSVSRWMAGHMAWSWLIVLPLLACILWLLFRRRARFNYFESLVLLLYLVGQTFVFRLLLLPFRYMGNTGISFTTWANLLYLLYAVAAMYQFFELEISSRWQRIWRVLMAVGASLFAVCLLIVLLVLYGRTSEKRGSPKAAFPASVSSSSSTSPRASAL
jgi:hypothetical protein